VILNDVNLEIRRGEIITMFGKNGSGKTTILNILTNNEHISSGSITYFKRIMFGISME
jgi:ABC-type multidrug transport system ATPase subunit